MVLPLMARSEAAIDRFWIGFSYSHSHGDGKSIIAFHRTFLQGLQANDHPPVDMEHIETIQTPDLPLLLPSLEEAANLSIWSFLLLPLISVYLLAWLCSYVHVQQGPGSSSEAWKATRSVYKFVDDITEDQSQFLEVRKMCRSLFDVKTFLHGELLFFVA